MRQPLRKEVFGLIREALLPLGYRKRSEEGTLTRDLNEAVVGQVGLADTVGRDTVPYLRVIPFFGVRHQTVETMFNELMEEEWRPTNSKPSPYALTIKASLRELRPPGEPERWEFEAGTQHTAAVHDLVTAVETFG